MSFPQPPNCDLASRFLCLIYISEPKPLHHPIIRGPRKDRGGEARCFETRDTYVPPKQNKTRNFYEQTCI